MFSFSLLFEKIYFLTIDTKSTAHKGSSKLRQGFYFQSVQAFFAIFNYLDPQLVITGITQWAA